jgi:hypothetical protein
MKTITIKIKDPKALKFILHLQELNLLQIISHEKDEPEKNLSERLSGSVSAEQAVAMHAELQRMRNEWERDI